MGESIVETPVKKKMSGPTLEVSVSFGRFENDALSWEKWSSFSPNKYLEEVEKCSTPGSVAQKKAYFEAHYKRIAAQKMEQLELEKQQVDKEKEPLPPILDEPTSGDESENTQVFDADFSSSNGDSLAVDEQQTTMIDLKNSDAVDEAKEDIAVDVEFDDLSVTKAKEQTISGIELSKEDTSVDTECDSSLVTEATKEGTILGIDESKEDISVDVKCDSLLETKAKEGTIFGTYDQVELHKIEEESAEKGCQESLIETPQVHTEAQKSSIKKSKNTKANVKNAPRKVHPTEDRVSAVAKKKLTSPVTKSSKTFTPTSKSASISRVISPSQPSAKKVNGASTQRSNYTPLTQRKKVVPGSTMSPSQSSNKKLNGTTLQRSTNSPMLEKKRVASTSLHMSLSLGSPNSTASTAAPTTTMRKSLIMEKMGDKDIVKRAFRAFQNSLNQGRSAGDMTYGGQEQVSSKGSEQKSSISLTPRKESERLKKTPDKAITLKGRWGTPSTSLSSRAPKDAGVEKKKVNSVRASTGLRPDRSTDKWKEMISSTKSYIYQLSEKEQQPHLFPESGIT